MINPCVKCPERDRCEGMNQPCKQVKLTRDGKPAAREWRSIRKG